MTVMGTHTGNIAVTNAIQNHEKRRLPEMELSKEQKEYMLNIERYRLAMSLAKSMLTQGIISELDYAVIDTIMTKKYGVSSYTIFG